MKELIRKLEKVDPDLIVCVEAYEIGFTENISVNITTMIPNPQYPGETWVGEWKEPWVPPSNGTKVLAIKRRS